MTWIARIAAFAAALMVGSFTGFVASQDDSFNGTAVVDQREEIDPRTELTTADLLGTWKGSWGYNSVDCTIEITWVKGDEFSGTLRKEGAEILVHGTFSRATRAVEFREIKVVRLGADMRQWSLGENRGSLSRDGRIMYGTGVDEWGQYAWAVSDDR